MTTAFAAVIMAGGSGQRFWPLSTSDRPKQFLDLERHGRSLLQATWDRVSPLAGRPECTFVVTGGRYAKLVADQLPDLPTANLLLEPIARDTAPAIALAALEARRRLGDVVLGVFPSDHRVGDVARFQVAIRDAVDLARRTGGIVTLGVQPDRPATAYGYIQRGEPVLNGFRVARFVEKPDVDRARAYLAAGTYAWNAGIFVSRVEALLGELDRHAPDIVRPLDDAVAEGRVAETFPTLRRVSIDVAVLEATDNAYVLPADFAWDDIGDWQALERLLSRTDGDTAVGRHIGLGGGGNIVYSDDDDGVIVTVGIEDVVVVHRRNTVLVVPKDRVQDIKRLFEDGRFAPLLAG